MNKALIIGTNYYIGLSVIRCLARKKIHVVACDYDLKHSYGAKSKYIDEFLEIKNLRDLDSSVCEVLVNYGKKQKEKPVLFPTHDKYVEFIDEFYDELKPYFLFSQAKDKLSSRLMDKYVLAGIAKECKVKIPASIDIADSDVYSEVEDNIGYPCIVKPVDTVTFTKCFRRKVFVCENEGELREGISKCNEKGINAFIQQIIPGFDDHMLTYDSYIDQNGKTTHYMTAQKLRQWPINFGASVFTIQKYNKKLVDIGMPFLEGIGYRGFSEIEFKKHETTGEIYLIEINVRTTNFNNLIYKVGINMPYVCYLDLTGKPLEECFIDYDTRYAFIYGFEDFMSIIHYKKAKQLTVARAIRDSLSRRWAPAIFDIRDLSPWLYENSILFKKFLKKILRKKNV